MKNIVILMIFNLILLSSCKKDPEIIEPENTTIMEVHLHNVANNEAIVIPSGKYLNANKDTFSINALKYLVSNVKLYNQGVLKYTESNSYHFVDETIDASKLFSLKDIPTGTYDKMEVAIGVDANHDNGSASEGDLSPDNGLYWSGWASYIYFRFDGLYHNDTSLALSFHAGGSSAYAVYELDLTLNPIVITENKTSSIHINTNVDALFDSPNQLDFSILRNVAAKGTTMDSLGTNLKTGIIDVEKVING